MRIREIERGRKKKRREIDEEDNEGKCQQEDETRRVRRNEK